MHVLIIRLSAIGDVVQGIPCLVALKRKYPDWQFSWLVQKKCAPLLKDHPYLNQLFVLSPQHHSIHSSKHQTIVEGPFRHLLAELRREPIDISIDLQGLIKSALWGCLCGAKRRIGYRKAREWTSLFINDPVGTHPIFDPNYPLLNRYLEPAVHLGADPAAGTYVLPSASPEDQAQVLVWVAPLSKNKPILALCPWSAWPSKNWPLENWIECLQRLVSDCHVLLLGDDSHLVDAQNLCRRLPRVINLVGQTSLTAMAELFRHCTVVVGPDSGPLHIANATGIPHIVMLFGPTSWKRSGPVGTNHQTLSTHLPCQPCFKRICPLGHLKCQHDLTVDKVLSAIQDALKLG